MIEKKYNELKENYIEHITDLITDMGGLYPHVTVFADQKKDDELPAIIHIPIPEELMQSDKGKEEFVNDILPDVFKSLQEDFIPYGVAWASEAWMRSVKTDEMIPDDYKEIPIKKEIIIITLETSSKEEVIIYEIKRSGKKVNKFGDFIDGVELVLQPDMNKPNSMSGKFSGLFKKFKS